DLRLLIVRQLEIGLDVRTARNLKKAEAKSAAKSALTSSLPATASARLGQTNRGSKDKGKDRQCSKLSVHHHVSAASHSAFALREAERSRRAPGGEVQ